MKVEYAKRPLKPKPIMTPLYLEELENKRKRAATETKRVKKLPCLTPAEANLLGWSRKIKDNENDEFVVKMLEKAKKRVLDEGNQNDILCKSLRMES